MKDPNIIKAQEMTEDAQQKLQAIRQLLKAAVESNFDINCIDSHFEVKDIGLKPRKPRDSKPKLKEPVLNLPKYVEPKMVEFVEFEAHLIDVSDVESNPNIFTAKNLKPLPAKPNRDSPVYRTELSFVEKLIPGRADLARTNALNQYERDLDQWHQRTDEVIEENVRLENMHRKELTNIRNQKRRGSVEAENEDIKSRGLREYDAALKRAEKAFVKDKKRYQTELERAENKHLKAVASYEKSLKRWNNKKKAYDKNKSEQAADLKKVKDGFMGGKPLEVAHCIELMLGRSDFPFYFNRSISCEYISSNRSLVIDYRLPKKGDLPRLDEVRYIKTKAEFREKVLGDSALNALYDELLYQTTLRSVYEVYQVDQNGVIGSVVFNGWVKGVDPRSGNDMISCILSLQATRAEFELIKLNKVDAKSCFKSLKGIGSAKLHSIVPVAPILQATKTDNRFVPHYSVVDSVDEGANLAAMDWQDFENLIREIFELEFSSNGGEVKITQASRDGGVDAIAFDPDPIRGGKIVIQAKRYTNVVGVSAVRDLYGTVLNEGATKGILVTTADFGADSYSFAKDKPLTLLNGGNLLHLLGQHGHRAHINLRDAKNLLAANT